MASPRPIFVAALLCVAACGSPAGKQNASHTAPQTSPKAAVPVPVPTDIASLVQTVNALPLPVTIANFVAALPHPLAVNATSSQASLQPAVDDADPRIFISVGSLILSVVPIGKDANTMEVGEMDDSDEMTPAQLTFPITQAITLADLYTPIVLPQGGGTICAQCHGAERAVAVAPGVTAYATGQVGPSLGLDVPASQMSVLDSTCDKTTQPQRCALFDALTQPEPPTQYTF